MTTTILGQSSTTDQGPWKGTAEIQMDVRNEIIASDCRLLNEELNQTIARWLTAWNFPGAAIPRIVRDIEPPEDLSARAEREAVVGTANSLRRPRAEVERIFGGEWEERNGAETVELPDGGAAAMATMLAGVDDFPALDGGGDDWQPVGAQLIRPALRAARRAGNYDVFMNCLNKPERVKISRLTKALHRAIFSADMVARFNSR